MSTQLLLTFLYLAIFLCYWLLRNKHSLLCQWPLLGMLPSLLVNVRALHDFITEGLRRAGGTFLFKGPSFIKADYLVMSDPANINHIFNKNAANYDKGRDFKAIMEALGDGIFNVDGDSWKLQRKLLHSLLNNSEFEGHSTQILTQKMRSTLMPVLDRAARRRRTTENDQLVDLQDVFKRFMFDNMCLLVLGFDPHYLPDVGSDDGGRLPDCECGKAFDVLERVAIYRHVVPVCLWRLQHRLGIGIEGECFRAWSTLDQFLYGSIKRKKQELATKHSVSNDVHERKKLDLLTQVLVMKDEDDGGDGKIIDKKSDRFLRDITLTLIAAGRDTITACLTWVIWCVANHPAIEKKILQELRQVMAARLLSSDIDGEERGGFFRNDELNKLVYLHATICETLRLYPPVPFEHKCAVEADVLPSGHTVRKEERIIFSIYGMARMEEIWGEDCLEFKPERWISEKGTILHVPSYKFMTFLAGARTCLGKNMSFTQVKSLASALLWNYKFELIDDGPYGRPTISLVLFMKEGLKTRVSKRDH
ncbi:unnamed protein product [Linum tenue]|uniref:Cytochrome P450 n=1 Tax=Linum tenue TaxID=586396 RepID=A0AAV0N950_9ROSI|nr:unnamed protein product [Linum tenue]